jgi:hypothetical protein
MNHSIKTVSETISLIEKGNVLLISGDENLLKQLPKGNWIGGTIPYFITANGGLFTKEQVYVNDFTHLMIESKIMTYHENSLKNIAIDAFGNGFSLLILPYGSATHLEFALHAPQYSNIFQNPLAGFISGVALEEIGKVSPKTLNGQTGELSDSKALALHCLLPTNKLARLEIINIFDTKGQTDTIEFVETTFTVKECKVNGETMFLSDYIQQKNVDTRMPLVTDLLGAKINVSIQSINTQDKLVNLYAPVFKQQSYQFATQLPDYVTAFADSMPESIDNCVFSCNCILNYAYGKLEGKKIPLRGPTTFGEIGYRLLNQTLVYMVIEDTH